MKPAELRLWIGQRVRDLRVAQAVGSQDALAEATGLHRTYIGRLERGETGVTVEVLARVTDALGISLSEFFEPADEMDADDRGVREKRSARSPTRN